MDAQIKTVIENLEKNGIRAFYAQTRQDALAIVKTLIPDGSSVGSGGSVSLNESGVLDFLRKGNFTYYDRAAAKTEQETEIVFAKEKQADFYLSSSNAITLNGELYNVDGRGNRVAAITHGPKNVIIIAGKNKIVKDLDEAVLRVKTIAAPKNSARLNYQTYCLNKGKCASLETHGDLAKTTAGMTLGCTSQGRICRHYLVTGCQRIKDRITVILVNENLGY